jgi:hypothetical protein
MSLFPPSRRRRGVSGILAGIILFAMLFTVGMGFFTYQNNLNNQYNHANFLAQQSLQGKVSEATSILAYPNRAGPTLNVSAVVSNVGAGYINLTSLFIEDQTGRVTCFSPPGGLTDCRPYYGHTLTKVTLPKTILSVGAATNITTDIKSTDASVTSCSTKTPCFVGVITSRGNVFTGLYPGPIVSLPVTITTTLNATLIAPGGHVHDTALLSGISANAGGTVKYYYFADGVCSTGQTLVSSQTVTNGVVPNSDFGFPSGTQFATAGYYSWEAVYTGDAHNSAATSLCEPLTVSSSVCTPSQTQFCFATVAQGLGSIAFDFNSFKWYTLHTVKGGAIDCPPGNLIGNAPTLACWFSDGTTTKYSVGACGSCGSAAAPLAYSIDQTPLSTTTQIGFSMNVTNADPAKRSITLNQYTQLWFSYFNPSVNCCSGNPHGQQVTYYFGLVNLVSTDPTNLLGGKIALSIPTVTIPYGQTVTLFFALEESTSGAGGAVPLIGFSGYLPNTAGTVTPVFIFFQGTVGPNAMGQDFPLASTLWKNIH